MMMGVGRAAWRVMLEGLSQRGASLRRQGKRGEFRAKLRPGERVLSLLSRSQVPAEGSVEATLGTLEGALRTLEEKVPDFHRRIEGRAVVDFGCGRGMQSVALAQRGAARVLGVDTDLGALERGRALVLERGLEGRVEFVGQARPQDLAQYDVVISHNSMEHFPDPRLVLGLMRELVRPGGELVITFGPPWYAPYGSHLRYLTPLPWVNLLFSEETVMKVRARHRKDGARRYAEVKNGLNQMTVARFEGLVRELGVRVAHWRCDAVKGARPLARLPKVRELFINQVTCVLEVPR
jgi:2-polyprenyl-3-methyl-5-hydroxy-6-metoxy-1,4-benzoquinol methylase